jgi:hypothetical protein
VTSIAARDAALPWNRFSGEKRMDDETKLEQGQPPAQSQVQIKSDENELQGMYSNLMLIHYSC